MSWIRWAITIIAFPIGGWIAFQVVGPVSNPLTAASAAAIAGAVIGLAQGVALGGRRGVRWGIATLVGMVAGVTVSALITGASVEVPALGLTGLVTGLFVGSLQALTLGSSWRVIAIWTATVGVTWGLAWVISANVITANIELGFVTFGLSGALLVTVVTAFVLRRILGPITRREATQPATPAAVVADATR
jgi:hypothetical protein